MKILFLCISLLTLLLFAQSEVSACTCGMPNLTTEKGVIGALKYNKAVFSGEIIEIKRIPETRDLLVKIKVNEFWKGELYKEMTLTTPSDSAACGYYFQTGASYLIFASGWDKNKLSTELCSGSRKIENAAEIINILGKGKEPAEKSYSQGSRQNCPNIYLVDPEIKNVDPKIIEPVTGFIIVDTFVFKVLVENADPKLKLTYKWTIYEGGEIESGQGTPALTAVKIDWRKRVRADVEIGGLEKGCRNTAEGSNY